MVSGKKERNRASRPGTKPSSELPQLRETHVYPPGTMTPEESLDHSRAFNAATASSGPPDDALRQYVDALFATYRATLEQYFPALTSHLWIYQRYPFETFILRLDTHGSIIGHRPAERERVHILRPEDLDPPLAAMNFFDVQKRWKTPLTSFSFYVREYGPEEGAVEGRRMALQDALTVFWAVLSPEQFHELCLALLHAEGVLVGDLTTMPPFARDALGSVTLHEPAGFRRVETWAFEFRHDRHRRVSVATMRRIAAILQQHSALPDSFCLLTPEDLTSIGRNIIVEHPRLRVWDRPVLDRLIYRHLDVLAPYFPDFIAAIDGLSQLEPTVPSIDPEQPSTAALRQRLRECPTGKEYFAAYESAAGDIWDHLFVPSLKRLGRQRSTDDGEQRRDGLYRNGRGKPFWQRVAHDYNASLIVVDYKNAGRAITTPVINDVRKYANRAVGQCIFVITRQGIAKAARAAAHRIFGEDGPVILVITDAELLEVIERKERGEDPEDILEDLLDDFLAGY